MTRITIIQPPVERDLQWAAPGLAGTGHADLESLGIALRELIEAGS